MSSVNWNEFQKLPGSQEKNFEVLCRRLIRLHYGQYGLFRATANQPGVEFHLKLHSQCALGGPQIWMGWQCKWYDLPQGRPIGKSRRDQILRSIRVTEKFLPDLTDWVLWTRFPLTAGDQKWYEKIPTKMRLSLSTAEDAEMLLSGDAEILRSTFFGELVLRPENLASQHELSVASIRHRWIPEAHQQVDVERTLRRMLGESAAWDEMLEVATRLAFARQALQNGVKSLPPLLASLTATYAQNVGLMADALKQAHQVLMTGDFDLLRQIMDTRPSKPDRKAASVPRLLRASRHDISFEATDALADLHLAGC